MQWLVTSQSWDNYKMINSQYQNKYRLLIDKKGMGRIDVTNKKAVIYGCGQGFFELFKDKQIRNISCVIDADKRKEGSYVQISNKLYEINTPEILRNLDVEENYIIITSKFYEKQMIEKINEVCGDNAFDICYREELYYQYESLAMLWDYDPIAKLVIARNGLSFYREQIVELFKMITKKKKLGKITEFIPVSSGAKFCFIFGDNTNKYIIGIPGFHTETSMMRINRDSELYKKIRFNVRKKLRIDEELTVYEDEMGVIVQHYADEITDFSSKQITYNVLNLLRRLHQSDEIVDIDNDELNYYYIEMSRNISKLGRKEYDDILLAMNPVIEDLRKIKVNKTLCHGDMHCGNIVTFNHKQFMIDWEFLGMGNPMFDVCGFLMSVGLKQAYDYGQGYKEAIDKVYEELFSDLYMYYGRIPEEREYHYAKMITKVCECRELFIKILYSSKIPDNETLYSVLEHIND